MKKLMIVLTFALLFTGFSSTSQESKIGIKGGFNLSTLTTDGNDDKNFRPGFHVGVFNKMAITDAFAIQPELLYTTKGVKYAYDNAFAEGDSKFTLNYIELPLKLVYNLSSDFELQLGPYVGYLLNANVETDTEVLDAWDIASEDDIDRDQFKNFDFGLSFGLGFDFDPLVVGFNYNLGITQVAEGDEISDGILGDAKNAVIQVYAGIKF